MGFSGLKESFTMDAIHADPTIEGCLTLLEKDIVTGRQVSTLPLVLEAAMLAAIQLPANLGQDIEGDVAV